MISLYVSFHKGGDLGILAEAKKDLTQGLGWKILHNDVQTQRRPEERLQADGVQLSH